MKQAFFPHLINGSVFVSEKLMDASGNTGFKVVLKMDGTKVEKCFRETLTKSHLDKCIALTKQFGKFAKSKNSGLDPLQLLTNTPDMTNFQSIAMVKLLSEYTTAVLIYGAAVQQYKAASPQIRLEPNLAIDLYRKALGFYDLETAISLIEEDTPYLSKAKLRAYHIAELNDIFYHIYARAGYRKEAFGRLKQAWRAAPTQGRSKILMNEAAYFTDSDEVVRHANYLKRWGDLSPRMLALLAVSQIRLQRNDEADQILAELRSKKTEDAEKMISNVERFKNSIAP